MKRIILIFLASLFLLKVNYAENGWYQLSCGLNVDFYSLYFTSAGTGYIVGNDFILKTIDGGSIWSISLYAPSERFRHIVFVNQSTGIVIGRDGLVMKTTNSGMNWISINSGTLNDLLQLYMINENTGYICGGFGTYLKTTNGGDYWFGYPICNSHMYSVFFTSAATGWIAGDLGLLFRTTNGGNNWTNRQLIQNVDLREILFLTPSTGWTTGEDGNVFCTTNGGNNWILQNSGTISTYHHLVMRNSSKGWMVGDSSILSTTDLGVHWNSQLKAANETFVQAFFTSDTLGYVVGWGGVILKTTNGGNPIGITPILNNAPVTFNLYQNFPNPFNPNTKIKFDIPSNVKRETSNVKIIIYNVLGREIAVLVNQQMQPGTHEIEWNASNYPSGVYFYKLVVSGAEPLTAGDYSETKKMMLIK